MENIHWGEVKTRVDSLLIHLGWAVGKGVDESPRLVTLIGWLMKRLVTLVDRLVDHPSTWLVDGCFV